MTGLGEDLRRTIEGLRRETADFALVGGLAVSVRTEPRFTRDIDLAVAVADDNQAERVVRAMGEAGFVLEAATEQAAAGRLATVRLRSPAVPAGIVDLLFASSGIEPEVVAAAERLEALPDLTLPVARTGHLVALKLLARDDELRPQDLADLRALAAVADEDEVILARGACETITLRGFARGRDLETALGDLVSL